MGAENLFEDQSSTPPTPDESERVEDVAKAEEMARFSDPAHSMAAEKRRELENLGHQELKKNMDLSVRRRLLMRRQNNARNRRLLLTT